jgi:hypothetical protein
VKGVGYKKMAVGYETSTISMRRCDKLR